MTLFGFVMLIVVGAICGAIAEMVVGFSPGGFLASVAVGFVGAFVGYWVAGVLHLPSFFVVQIDRHPIEIVWTVLGSIILLLVVSVFRRSRHYAGRYG